MLSGSWSENLSGELVIRDMKAHVLEQILFYIYGALPQHFNIDLLVASDMLGMTSLKECMVAALEQDYCHFFHRVSTDNFNYKNYLSIS